MLRIGTLNVHCIKTKLNRLTQLVKDQRCDIIFLQEISHETTRKLSDTLKYGFIYSPADHMGNACLSRYPFEEYKTIKLRPDNERYRYLHETRSAIYASIKTPTQGIVNVCGTHLDHISEEVRIRQLTDLFSEIPVRKVDFLCGDFNALNLSDYSATELEKIAKVRRLSNWETPKGDLMETLSKCGFRIYPYQTGTSRFDTRVDYILYQAGWKVQQNIVDTIETKLTDHKMVVAEVSRRKS